MTFPSCIRATVNGRGVGGGMVLIAARPSPRRAARRSIRRLCCVIFDLHPASSFCSLNSSLRIIDLSNAELVGDGRRTLATRPTIPVLLSNDPFYSTNAEAVFYAIVALLLSNNRRPLLSDRFFCIRTLRIQHFLFSQPAYRSDRHRTTSDE